LAAAHAAWAADAGPSDRWTVWAEGGAFLTGGQEARFGQPKSITRNDFGGEGGLGLSYRPDGSPWRLIGEARYSSTRASGVIAAATTYQGSPYSETGRWNSHEDHWLADFAVGRDMAIGVGTVEVEGGLRIAEVAQDVSSKVSYYSGCSSSGSSSSTGPSGAASGPVPPGPGGSSGGGSGGGGCTGSGPQTTYSVHSAESYFGAGPHVGLGLHAPIGAGFKLEAHGGIAALYGDQSLRTTTTTGAAVFGLANAKLDKGAFVFNSDAEVGLSHPLTSRIDLNVAYRFDGYWAALRTVGPTGHIHTDDRYFSGPSLRLSFRLP
jgi:hypothetical protein